MRLFSVLQHVDEIATMAIDLLAAVKQVKIPHQPDEKLMLRIGLHSGTTCSFFTYRVCGRGNVFVVSVCLSARAINFNSISIQFNPIRSHKNFIFGMVLYLDHI